MDLKLNLSKKITIKVLIFSLLYTGKKRKIQKFPKIIINKNNLHVIMI